MTLRVRLQPNSPTPIFGQIVGQVRQAVAQGRLRRGEQLPTVRELAVELVVNPNTVAKAYQDLEKAGVITTRRGAGTFVADGECALARAERERLATRKIEEALTEAVHLALGRSWVERRLRECLDRFQWPEERHE